MQTHGGSMMDDMRAQGYDILNPVRESGKLPQSVEVEVQKKLDSFLDLVIS
jgi:hypothetical protein